MITFALGVSATIVVGMLVWFTIDTIKQLKRIKQLEKEKEQLWLEIQHRCDSIIRALDEVQHGLSKRIDENYSYTDSRFDKLENKLTNKNKK